MRSPSEDYHCDYKYLAQKVLKKWVQYSFLKKKNVF